MEKTFTKEEVTAERNELTAGLMILSALLIVSNKLGKRKGRKETLKLRKEFERGVEAHEEFMKSVKSEG